VPKLISEARAPVGNKRRTKIRQNIGRPRKCNTDVTLLKDIGLTRMDSSRAQKVFEHQDLIPVVVAKAEKSKDLPTRKVNGFIPSLFFDVTIRCFVCSRRDRISRVILRWTRNEQESQFEFSLMRVRTRYYVSRTGSCP